MQNIEILHSVGQGGKNKAIDVALIQALLKNYYLSLNKNDFADKQQYDFSFLAINGDCSDLLIEAINEFQKTVVKMNVPDGRIDPRGGSFKKLIATQTIKAVSMMKTLFDDSDVNVMTLDVIGTQRFKNFFRQYHGLTISKGEDLEGFFNKLKSDSNITCLEWGAYILATAYHETMFSFKPKSEAGKGQGYQYAKVFDVTDVNGLRGEAGLSYQNVYYGRGYVQITWDFNYKHLGEVLGMGDSLFVNPDLALDPDIAYQITSLGMRLGSFTGKKLSDYINENKVDYVNARRIINGTDHASKIAEYAQSIECLLRLASNINVDMNKSEKGS